MAADSFFQQVVSVRLNADRTAVDILDQTLLPGTIQRLELRTKEDMREAIASLRVRGAPAIGVAAAYGLAVLASDIQAATWDDFCQQFHELKKYLAASRPTAVNLSWALNRMEKFLLTIKNDNLDEARHALFDEAGRIHAEDIAISKGLGAEGLKLMNAAKRTDRPLGILTHCNAGTLATSMYGTATAPMYCALEAGWNGNDMHVYCDETRPLLQGARLTAFELHQAGIATTLQCDNMVASLMRQGCIDMVFVGCDRVAANGDIANKIGTSGVAILARHYGIPFYVFAPSSTIDMATPSGDHIPIEMRDPSEVTDMWYQKPMAPEGIDVYNPAFDVTDHELITGIVTERGICQAPFEEAFHTLGLDMQA